MKKQILFFLIASIFLLPCLAEAERYALLIGQDYTESAGQTEVPECRADVTGMQTLLENLAGIPYETRTVFNPTVQEMEESILGQFRDAEEDSVCLIYFSGHGNESSRKTDGGLIGSDGKILPVDDLRSLLAAVPGKKIIIADCCRAGVLAQALSDPDCCVLASCGADEKSYVSSAGYSLFTAGLLSGGGFDLSGGTLKEKMPADADKDGSLTLAELYRYTFAYVMSQNAAQHVQMKTGSDEVLWKR